jgi:hypothetical protein
MSVRDELRDPWALVLGGLAGGLGWAAGIPVLAAAGIGAAVLGVKVLAGTAMNRSAHGGDGPSIPRGSPEDTWIRRGERAVAQIRREVAAAGPGPFAEECTHVEGQATAALTDVRRLAGQGAGLRQALAQVEAVGLSADEARLSSDLERTTDPEIRGEVQRSLDSIRAQLGVQDRLRQAFDRVMARLQSLVIGLEGLMARLTEVLAIARSRSPLAGAQQVEGVARELEALREGLQETEDLGRQALDAWQARPPRPDDRPLA